MNGAPGTTYEKVLDAIKVVGFPIVMCFIFISWEAGWLPSQTRQIIKTQSDHDFATRELTAAINSLRAATRSQVLLTTCLSYARDVGVQRQCVEDYQRTGS